MSHSTFQKKYGWCTNAKFDLFTLSHYFSCICTIALRLVRICSEQDTLLTRMQELKEMLLSRMYNKNIVNAALKRALETSREEALKRVEKKKKKDRVTFVVTYNPKLPSISGIVKKHWRSLTRDKEVKEIFPEPPLVAYKQPPNLRLSLCRAALPQLSRPQRSQVGYKRCLKSCNVCSYSMSTREKISKETVSKSGERFPMKGLYGCQTQGVIYVISCLKCKKQYVGQTGRSFYLRGMEHLRSVRAKDKTIGLHFSSACKDDDLKMQVIEKVFPNSEPFLLERENYWIKTLKTKHPHGLNKNVS